MMNLQKPARPLGIQMQIVENIAAGFSSQIIEAQVWRNRRHYNTIPTPFQQKERHVIPS